MEADFLKIIEQDFLKINPPKALSTQWIEYNQYRNNGVKKLAKKKLEELIDAFYTLNSDTQKDFVFQVCEVGFEEYYSKLVQFPLFKQCILPVLLKGYTNRSVKEIVYLLKACRHNFSQMIEDATGADDLGLAELGLEIDPSNSEFINFIANNYVNALDFGAHHLPKGMILENSVSKIIINEASDFIEKHQSYVDKKTVSDLEYFSELYRDYEVWESSDRSQGFEAWCIRHKRDYHWIDTINYEE